MPKLTPKLDAQIGAQLQNDGVSKRGVEPTSAIQGKTVHEDPAFTTSASLRSGAAAKVLTEAQKNQIQQDAEDEELGL